MTITEDGVHLLAAILEHPEDDDRRLVYADWLEESGLADIAAAIRNGVKECERTTAYGAGTVLQDHVEGQITVPHGCDYFYHRGMIWKVRCTLDAWLMHGPAIVRAHPVTRVELTDRKPSTHYRPPLGDWYWVCQHGDTGHIVDRLLPVLYAFLPEGVGEDEDEVMTYQNPQLATDALSVALLAWAKHPDRLEAAL